MEEGVCACKGARVCGVLDSPRVGVGELEGGARGGHEAGVVAPGELQHLHLGLAARHTRARGSGATQVTQVHRRLRERGRVQAFDQKG